MALAGCQWEMGLSAILQGYFEFTPLGFHAMVGIDVESLNLLGRSCAKYKMNKLCLMFSICRFSRRWWPATKYRSMCFAHDHQCLWWRRNLAGYCSVIDPPLSSSLTKLWASTIIGVENHIRRRIVMKKCSQLRIHEQVSNADEENVWRERHPGEALAGMFWNGRAEFDEQIAIATIGHYSEDCNDFVMCKNVRLCSVFCNFEDKCPTGADKMKLKKMVSACKHFFECTQQCRLCEAWREFIEDSLRMPEWWLVLEIQWKWPKEATGIGRNGALAISKVNLSTLNSCLCSCWWQGLNLILLQHIQYSKLAMHNLITFDQWRIS